MKERSECASSFGETVIDTERPVWVPRIGVGSCLLWAGAIPLLVGGLGASVTSRPAGAGSLSQRELRTLHTDAGRLDELARDAVTSVATVRWLVGQNAMAACYLVRARGFKRDEVRALAVAAMAGRVREAEVALEWAKVFDMWPHWQQGTFDEKRDTPLRRAAFGALVACTDDRDAKTRLLRKYAAAEGYDPACQALRNPKRAWPEESATGFEQDYEGFLEWLVEREARNERARQDMERAREDTK